MTRQTAVLIVVLALAPAARADKVVLVAGGGDGPDGSKATEAKVVQPFAVDFAADGSLLFVEMVGGERLRKIGLDGRITTLAGSGKKGDAGDGGPALQAEFNGMHNLVIGPDGSVYLADAFNNRVRRYDPKAGIVTAFAGTGAKGFAGDGGPALQAEFNQTICIAFGPGAKTMYVADIGNRRVRAIDRQTGVVTTFAGNGSKGVPKDGEPAKDQPLVDPRAVAADAKGNVYILERSGHALRVVDPEGKIRTVAGTGKPGKGGDGGPALKAAFNGPKYVAIDRDGSVLIADTENHQIRRYVPGKEVVELVAGTGRMGSAGVGGDPLKLELKRPHGVTTHPTTGELYIADSENGRILKIVKE
jgi:DNA-binding beta-propeller fold protein YncE